MQVSVKRYTALCVSMQAGLSGGLQPSWQRLCAFVSRSRFVRSGTWHHQSSVCPCCKEFLGSFCVACQCWCGWVLANASACLGVLGSDILILQKILLCGWMPAVVMRWWCVQAFPVDATGLCSLFLSTLILLLSFVMHLNYRDIVVMMVEAHLADNTQCWLLLGLCVWVVSRRFRGSVCLMVTSALLWGYWPLPGCNSTY